MVLNHYVPEKVKSEEEKDVDYIELLVPKYLSQAKEVKFNIIRIQASIKNILDTLSKKVPEIECEFCKIPDDFTKLLNEHKKLLEKINLKNKESVEELVEECKKLEKKAYYDDLTGIYNRCYIRTKIESLSAKALNFSICLIDLDNFKVVNDTYGHLVGDEVLKKFASFFIDKVTLFNKKNIEEKSKGVENEFKIISRYGGEEFILLSRGSKESLHKFMKECLEEFSKINHSSEKVDFNVTFSGGIQNFSKGMTYESLLNNADKALYKAKDDGRNRVLIY